MDKMETKVPNSIKDYILNNRSLIRVCSAIISIFIGFSASDRFAIIASGGSGEGVIYINSGYEIGFKVALITLGMYLLIKDLIIEFKSRN